MIRNKIELQSVGLSVFDDFCHMIFFAFVIPCKSQFGGAEGGGVLWASLIYLVSFSERKMMAIFFPSKNVTESSQKYWLKRNEFLIEIYETLLY